MSVEVAAGLAGISKGHLSMLERGQRRFERRGLLEDLAAALGCAVADLTGQPYLPVDRASADALACLRAISVALHDSTLTDAPDAPARPVSVLARLAAEANRNTHETRYALAGRGLGAVLSELHTRVVADTGEDRQAVLTALVEACIAAAGMARPLGHAELSITATRRGYDAVRHLGTTPQHGQGLGAYCRSPVRSADPGQRAGMLHRSEAGPAPTRATSGGLSHPWSRIIARRSHPAGHDHQRAGRGSSGLASSL